MRFRYVELRVSGKEELLDMDTNIKQAGQLASRNKLPFSSFRNEACGQRDRNVITL
jgi:hypothetical protein